MFWLWLILGLAAFLVVLLLAAGPLRRFGREALARRARQLFGQQREHLEAKFLSVAAASGKPRGLRWIGCEWDNGVEFARDRRTGDIVALVSVTIRFEAIEGGDMEGLPAVGNLRHASAVFWFDGRRWQTSGKTVFNLNPVEAIEHHRNQYERVSPATDSR